MVILAGRSNRSIDSRDDEFCFTKFDEYAQVFISLFCFINQLYLYQADDHALKFKQGSMNIWLKFKFSFHADQ